MKKGDIVKFRNVVVAGDEDLRMILLEDPDGGRVLVGSIVGRHAGKASKTLVYAAAKLNSQHC